MASMFFFANSCWSSQPSRVSELCNAPLQLKQRGIIRYRALFALRTSHINLLTLLHCFIHHVTNHKPQMILVELCMPFFTGNGA